MIGPINSNQSVYVAPCGKDFPDIHAGKSHERFCNVCHPDESPKPETVTLTLEVEAKWLPDLKAWQEQYACYLRGRFAMRSGDWDFSGQAANASARELDQCFKDLGRIMCAAVQELEL